MTVPYVDTGYWIDGYAVDAVDIPTPITYTSLTKTIPSYLYLQYSDDSDLQAFVASYNTMTQQYVDLFNQINLPIYTGPMIVGPVLDWVAEGLYGISRSSLPSGNNKSFGPLNTFTANSMVPNGYKLIGPNNYYATNDDIFKRIITWHFYKGDGKVFNVRWLKRRILRFLNGSNGEDCATDQTYQISVEFGIGNQINIRILNGVASLTGGALPRRFTPNTMMPNQANIKITVLTPLQYAPILQSAINAGVLELPFQYTYVVSI